MYPKYPLVSEYDNEYSMEECKEEVGQMNFNQSIFHEEKTIETMYPLVHPIPIMRSPPHHFLMSEADNYFNVKPNLTMNQNSTGTDEYQLPFLPIQHGQKFTNYDTHWQPNRPKQEPLDLQFRPFGEHFSSSQSYIMQHQQFVPNRTHFAKPSLKSIKREKKTKINPIGANYPIDDDTLLRISIPELNQQLKTIPSSEKDELKRKRRKLKNRLYAEHCRQRKKEQITGLNHKLNSEIENLRDAQAQNHKLRSQVENYKEECASLKNKLERALQDVAYYKEEWTSLMAKIGDASETSDGSKIRAHTTNEYS